MPNFLHSAGQILGAQAIGAPLWAWASEGNCGTSTDKNANEAVSYIHDRMPVILPLGREKSFLPGHFTSPYFIPEFAAELLTSYAVTPKISRASFNSPEAILPLEPAIT